MATPPRSEVISRFVGSAGLAVELLREGHGYRVRANGATLMASGVHGSEERMAELACASISGQAGTRVLVGGLGMGFTLRATLDVLPEDAALTVLELIPAVVEWNRGPLAELAGRPLDDPRVEVRTGDLVGHLRGRPTPYDAILLDVDNGPEAFTVPENDWLYAPGGLRALRTALRPGAHLAVWSAFRSPPFLRRLRQAGFDAKAVPVRARGEIRKGARHTIFLARLPPPPEERGSR
jgi:spermidine synthase